MVSASISEMYSKMNVVRVKLQEAIVACDDAIAFASAHHGDLSKAAAEDAKAAAEQQRQAINAICEAYAEAINLT